MLFHTLHSFIYVSLYRAWIRTHAHLYNIILPVFYGKVKERVAISRFSTKKPSSLQDGKKITPKRGVFQRTFFQKFSKIPNFKNTPQPSSAALHRIGSTADCPRQKQ